MTRQEVLDLLGALAERVSEDRVTVDDDEAISACHLLRHYLIQHMTDEDFPLEREAGEEVGEEGGG